MPRPKKSLQQLVDDRTFLARRHASRLLEPLQASPPLIVIRTLFRDALTDGERALRALEFEKALRPREVGVPLLYVIGSADGGGLVKIGWTRRSIRSRLLELQSFSPVDLAVLAVMPGDAAAEAHLKLTLAPWRRRGEWYERHSSVLAAFEVGEAYADV